MFKNLIIFKIYNNFLFCFSEYAECDKSDIES